MPVVKQEKESKEETRTRVHTTNPFLSPTSNPFLSPTSTPNWTTPEVKVSLTKPRDIPVLELHQLQSLDAAARLQMFFELVEQCSPSDATRVQIAKGRVTAELAVLVHSKQIHHKLVS